MDTSPKTRTLTTAELRANLDAALSELGHRERIVLERDGKPVAAIVSLTDLHALLRADAQRDKDFARAMWLLESIENLPQEERAQEVARLVAAERAAEKAQREKDFAIFDRFREAFAGVSQDEIEHEVAKAIDEVRAENRAKHEREQAMRAQ